MNRYFEDSLFPRPQSLRYQVGKPLRIGAESCIQAGTGCEAAESLLRAGLREIQEGDACIKLVLADLKESGIQDEQIAMQSYLLEAGEEIVLTGYGLPGLLYGVQTLLNCAKGEIPCCIIRDFPDFARRGMFMECRFGTDLMTLEDWEKLIDRMEEMRMNRLCIALYGCWSVQYDHRISQFLFFRPNFAPELATSAKIKYYSPKRKAFVDAEVPTPMQAEDFFGDLIAYGREKGIVVFPLVNSFGHNTLLPANFPETSAKDEDGKPQMTGFCTSNPATYELLFKIYDEIIDRYLAPNSIDSFSIGMDEVFDGRGQDISDIFALRSPWCKCPRCRDRSRGEIYVDHAVKLIRHLKQRGMKHVYIYNDMLVPHKYNTDTGDIAAKLMEALMRESLEDVVTVAWWHYGNHPENMYFKDLRPELGMERSVNPWNGYFHYSFVQDAVPNIRMMTELGRRNGAIEVQAYSAPDASYILNNLAISAYSWNGNGTGSEEAYIRSFADRFYGVNAWKAERALRLMCEITRKDEEGHDYYTLLFYGLSYYVYSYISADEPYPRRYPGQAIQGLLAEREKKEPMLRTVFEKAGRARQLWEEIGDERWAYEAENICLLADSFLTLLQLNDLAEQRKYDAMIAPLEGLITREMHLMARMENCKEDFLLASQMRNHSIRLVYLQDLLNYLKSAPAQDIRLDFTDNRHFASKEFLNLR